MIIAYKIIIIIQRSALENEKMYIMCIPIIIKYQIFTLVPVWHC